MDKLRLIDAINNSELDYNELYNNINIIDKDKTNFDSETYNEIIYLTFCSKKSLTSRVGDELRLLMLE